MSLNRRSNYQYYRPQTTSISTNRNRDLTFTKFSIFHMFLYFFIGFFLTYAGLVYFLDSEDKADPNTIALDSTPSPVAEQSAKQSNSILSFFHPQSTPNPDTLGASIKQDEKLLKLIQDKIPTDNGEYAIVVKQLDGSQDHQVTINNQNIFPAGSLYKLYVMAAALEKVEKGDITMDTVVTTQSDHLEQILGSTDFGYEDLRGQTISYTVEEILGRIARISDNYAAIMMAEKLDNWDYVRDYARRIGASDTTIKSPISTNAKDIANFFDLLYQKKIVSETASNKLIELLETAQLNQRIPAKLPKSGLRIAHKTGELPGVRHDAGIVFIENKDSNKESTSSSIKKEQAYEIILMSNNLRREDDGIDTLADISKVVYDYFINLKN